MTKKKRTKLLAPDGKSPARTWTIAELPSQPGPDRRAESLCPTASTIERAAAGEKVASAIIASWRPDFSEFIIRGCA